MDARDYFLNNTIYHYNYNLDRLRKGFRMLENEHVGIQALVDLAGRNGEAILPSVTEWLQNANQVIDKTRLFLESQAGNFNPVLNYFRFNTGKEAYYTNIAIDELITEGRSFSRLSYPAPAPPVLSASSGVHSVFLTWRLSGLQRFPLDDIQKATNHFDESKVIGEGGFGKVYKGIIHDGSTTIVVAVKRLNPESKQGLSEFQTEIKLLSGFQHCHVVSLVGYCDDSSEMILVYEFMTHGSLADHLYRNENSELPWNLRLKICIGAARGLDYLHTGTSVLSKIIHRDIKSANILLDENWAAKISDLGLSKTGPRNQPCSEVMTDHVKGTRGYIDPQYRNFRKLSRKTDVYAFGVVLLEVLTGTRAGGGGLVPDDTDLAYWTKQHVRERTLYQISDRRVRGEISPTSLVIFADIASKCLHLDPKKRPTMSEVVANLEFALACQEGTNPSSSIVDDELHQHFNAARAESQSKKFSEQHEVV